MFLKRLLVPAAAALACCAGTPAAWAAVKVDRCRAITAPGVYTLVKDVKASGFNCFEIKASNVTLDLANHTITGLGNNGGFGVGTPQSASPFSGITVIDGGIKNFTNGVQLGAVHGVAF